MNFHKCIYGKTVKDISLENYPFHDKLIVRPKYLVLSDEEGNETKYWFTEEDWSFVAGGRLRGYGRVLPFGKS